VNRRDFLRTTALALSAGAGWSSRSSAEQCVPTGADIRGPFFLPGAPERNQLAGVDEPGEPITIRGKILAVGCTAALSGALLDLWQADAQGRYHTAEEGYRLRGRIHTGADGLFEFTTIRPGRYRQGRGFRPSHVHFMVSHPDFKPLTTQLYFAGDPYLYPKDSCGSGCNSNDPSHIIELRPTQLNGKPAREGMFQIVLRNT
jgi:catechol 1,2-dioxygenase